MSLFHLFSDSNTFFLSPKTSKTSSKLSAGDLDSYFSEKQKQLAKNFPKLPPPTISIHVVSPAFPSVTRGQSPISFLRSTHLLVYQAPSPLPNLRTLVQKFFVLSSALSIFRSSSVGAYPSVTKHVVILHSQTKTLVSHISHPFSYFPISLFFIAQLLKRLIHIVTNFSPSLLS